MANEAAPSATPSSTATPGSTTPAVSSPKPVTAAATPSGPARTPSPASTQTGAAAGGTPPAGSPEPKPSETEGAVALRLVQEQRKRAQAESRARDLEARLKTLTDESNPFKTAAGLWKEKKYAQALKTGFGVKNFDDDFLVQVASAEEEPENLSPDQLRERIRQEMDKERKEAETAQEARIHELRGAAVQEVGSVLVANPEKWPTLWALGVRAEEIAAALDASYDRSTGRTAPPDKIFDDMEAARKAKIMGLPYMAQTGAPTPAPRSFSQGGGRGPVDEVDPAKPLTFAERQALRDQRDREFRARRFGQPV